MDDISVGDFAAQLMRAEEMGEQPTPTSPTFNPVQSNYSPNVLDQVDISKVEVPSNFIDTILEANKLPEEEHEVSVIEEDRVEVAEENPVAGQAIDIIIEGLGKMLDTVKETLNEVKKFVNEHSLVTEITTVGGIGVNMAPKKKKKKGTPSDEEEADPVQRILAQLRKKKSKK